jgi:hypothetical protein
MTDYLAQYYRCPEHYIRFGLKGSLSEESGYFRFGDDTVYGRYCGRRPASSPFECLYDALADTLIQDGKTYLPFDFGQVTEGLRYELYARASEANSKLQSAFKRLYYLARPLLPIVVRKRLQQLHARGWEGIPFPHWPVDRTVDDLFERLLQLSLRSSGADMIPFIWFWPHGATGCAIMTHDVETAAGRDSCTTFMDIDSAFGINASFQIVPEGRYTVTPSFRDSITGRGFELAVQDLNHDGHLFMNERKFMARVGRINCYGRQWAAQGFRAAVLYRRQEWFDALDFSYDMSVPNVAHLDPQRGGCCTVMPYFVGKILELPVTTIQDYTLFHILNEYSIDLWKQQMNLILEKHGLMSFIIHPDYMKGSRERRIYEALLAHLIQLREQNGVWMATPGEVNRWWRQRREMKLIEDGNNWRIQGAGSERAKIAYASQKDSGLVFTLAPAPPVREKTNVGNGLSADAIECS